MADEMEEKWEELKQTEIDIIQGYRLEPDLEFKVRQFVKKYPGNYPIDSLYKSLYLNGSYQDYTCLLSLLFKYDSRINMKM